MKKNKFLPLISLYLIIYKVQTKFNNLFYKILNYSQIIREGFWLAVLSEKSILSINERFYNNSIKYIDENLNRSSLFEWEEEMINKFFLNSKKIMVLGSGGGREIYALSKKDYEVEGFECNKTLVAHSQNFIKKEGLTSSIAYVEPNHCPDNNKIYDGIILGWGLYNHVKGRVMRINLLKEINTHLEIGSHVLLSYWWSNQNVDLYCKKIEIVNRFFCKIFFTKPIEKGDRITMHSGHYFTFQEVQDELKMAGFSVVYESAKQYGHTVAQKTEHLY
ncbi:MAG: hypothetical protein Q7U47_06245 [Paludibacter sp.]|nr:hypothetical protein [Paludibacter sp.]